MNWTRGPSVFISATFLATAAGLAVPSTAHSQAPGMDRRDDRRDDRRGARETRQTGREDAPRQQKID